VQAVAGQQEGLFGLSDLMANARLGMDPSQDDFFSQRGGFGGQQLWQDPPVQQMTPFQSFQSGLGGEEWKPPSASDAPAFDFNDPSSLQDSAPRYERSYQQF